MGQAIPIKSAVLLLACAALWACAPQADTPRALEAPEAPDVPAAPDSASHIMRITDIDFGSYSRDLAKAVKLEMGESMTSATPKIERFFSPQGGSIEDATDRTRVKTETEFSTFGAQGGKVTLVERVNIKDDSVKAEQFYAIFKSKGEGYSLVDYGLKIKCQRGENTRQWQTEPCP